jgi:hypothetical protein
VIVAVDGATATLGSAWSVTAGISAFARESSIFCQRITYSPANRQPTCNRPVLGFVRAHLVGRHGHLTTIQMHFLLFTPSLLDPLSAYDVGRSNTGCQSIGIRAVSLSRPAESTKHWIRMVRARLNAETVIPNHT